MDGRDSIQSLLVLRKLTRAIADTARTQMLEYLTVLAPLLRPKVVLGDFIHGSSKESAPRADKAFKDLQALYASVATARPFHLAPDLTPPLNFTGVGPRHHARGLPARHRVRVRGPDDHGAQSPHLGV